MGNVTVFEKAFKECGVGGRFSKFQLAKCGDWFELIHIDTLEDSRFCFKVHDRVDTRQMQPIGTNRARSLHQPDSQWATNFQMAQQVLAKIISKGTVKSENRYFYDYINDSVYITNRMFVIEVTPTRRDESMVCSSAIFSFLDEHGYTQPSDSDVVGVHTKFDKVVIEYNGQLYNTCLAVEDFNDNYSEVV